MALSRSHNVLRASASFSRWIAVSAFLALTSTIVVAQTKAVKTRNPKDKSSSFIDISLGVFGQLTSTRTPTNTIAEYPLPTDDYGSVYMQSTQGASAAAGVLTTFHQSFGRWRGYTLNFGYSRFTENYSQGIWFLPNHNPPYPPTYNFTLASVGASMYELTAAYMVEGPRAKHFDTFTQLGGGSVSFFPTQNPSASPVLFRPTLLFGGGMNYKLSEHWRIRAEYRGLLVEQPDFHGEYAGSPVPILKLMTVINEPTISIVYRFGGKK